MVAVALIAATAGLGVTAGRATADTLANKRAEAVQLNQKIQQLGQQEASLSEQYDKATLDVQAAQQRVTRATNQLAADQHLEGQARTALTNEAVTAYVNGGSETSPALTAAQPLGSVNQNVVRDEYLGNLASTQSDAADQYHLASLKTSDDRKLLQQALKGAEQQQATLAQDKQAVQNSADQMRATLKQVNGQIAALVAEIQREQRIAAERAAQQRLAEQRAAAALAAQQHQAQLVAQQQAAAAAQSSGLSSAAASAPVPAGGGSVASRAVAAALSRVGDPYVWGATGPGVFDCSGLVMWSYAQAGVSLPHYSGAQYGMGIKISMSQLAPGDLVFPSDPGEHVAMYIGGGNIVEAPYTGADVRVIPLSSFFVQAVRIPT